MTERFLKIKLVVQLSVMTTDGREINFSFTNELPIPLVLHHADLTTGADKVSSSKLSSTIAPGESSYVQFSFRDVGSTSPDVGYALALFGYYIVFNYDFTDVMNAFSSGGREAFIQKRAKVLVLEPEGIAGWTINPEPLKLFDTNGLGLGEREVEKKFALEAKVHETSGRRGRVLSLVATCDSSAIVFLKGLLGKTKARVSSAMAEVTRLLGPAWPHRYGIHSLRDLDPVLVDNLGSAALRAGLELSVKPVVPLPPNDGSVISYIVLRIANQTSADMSLSQNSICSITGLRWRRAPTDCPPQGTSHGVLVSTQKGNHYALIQFVFRPSGVASLKLKLSIDIEQSVLGKLSVRTRIEVDATFDEPGDDGAFLSPNNPVRRRMDSARNAEMNSRFVAHVSKNPNLRGAVAVLLLDKDDLRPMKISGIRLLPPQLWRANGAPIDLQKLQGILECDLLRLGRPRTAGYVQKTKGRHGVQQDREVVSPTGTTARLSACREAFLLWRKSVDVRVEILEAIEASGEDADRPYPVGSGRCSHLYDRSVFNRLSLPNWQQLLSSSCVTNECEAFREHPIAKCYVMVFWEISGQRFRKVYRPGEKVFMSSELPGGVPDDKVVLHGVAAPSKFYFQSDIIPETVHDLRLFVPLPPVTSACDQADRVDIIGDVHRIITEVLSQIIEYKYRDAVHRKAPADARHEGKWMAALEADLGPLASRAHLWSTAFYRSEGTKGSEWGKVTMDATAVRYLLSSEASLGTDDFGLVENYTALSVLWETTVGLSRPQPINRTTQKQSDLSSFTAVWLTAIHEGTRVFSSKTKDMIEDIVLCNDLALATAESFLGWLALARLYSCFETTAGDVKLLIKLLTRTIIRGS